MKLKCYHLKEKVMFKHVNTAYAAEMLDADKFPDPDAYHQKLTQISQMSPEEAEDYLRDNPHEFEDWDIDKQVVCRKKLVFESAICSEDNLHTLLNAKDEDFDEPKFIYKSVQSGLRALTQDITGARRAIRCILALRKTYYVSANCKDGGVDFLNSIANEWKDNAESISFADFLIKYRNYGYDHTSRYAGNIPDVNYEIFILHDYLQTDEVLNILQGDLSLLNAYIQDINCNTPYHITSYGEAMEIVEQAIEKNVLVPDSDGWIQVFYKDGHNTSMTRAEIAQALMCDSEGVEFFNKELKKRDHIRTFDTYEEMDKTHLAEEMELIDRYGIKQIQSSNLEVWNKMKERHNAEQSLFEKDYEHLCEELEYIMANHEYPKSGDKWLVLSDANKTVDDMKDDRFRAAFNEAVARRLKLWT